MSSVSSWRYILVIGFLLRLFCGIFIFKDVYNQYEHPGPPMLISESILQGNGYSIVNTPTAWEHPGFVYLLTAARFLSSDRPIGIIIALSLVGIAGCLLLYLLTKRLYGNKTAIIALALYTFNPIIIRNDFRVLVYSIFITSVLLVVYLYIRYKDNPSITNAFYLGFAVSINMVIRPTAILLIMYLFSICAISNYKRLLLVLGVSILLPGIWGIRNLITFNEFFVDSSGNAWAFYTSNSKNYASFNELFNTTTKKYKHDPHDQAEDSEYWLRNYWYKEGINHIIENPLKYCSLVIFRISLFFSPIRLPRSAEGSTGTTNRFLMDVLHFLFYTPFLVLSILAIYNKVPNMSLMLISICSICLIQCLVTTSSAYSLHVFPFITILASSQLWQNKN